MKNQLQLVFNAVALVSIISSTNASSGQCLHIPNGDFDNGTDGWKINFDTFHEGEAGAGANAGIADGTMLWDPLDEHTLRLDAIVSTGSTRPRFDHGDAFAEVTAQSVAPITARYLKLRIGGGFEWSNFGGASILMKASVRVRAADARAGGAEIVHVIRDSFQPGLDGCGLHVNVLGVFGNEPPIAMDMFEQNGQPTSLSLGQNVTVEIVATIGSTAIGECQGSELFLSLFVDEFMFCEPDLIGVPGDVTGDGVVNVDDLLEVIHHWGLCPLPVLVGSTCQAADIAPSGPPAGNGVVNVDDLLMVLNNWTG